MPAFEYLALQPTGKREKGILEGDTARQVRQRLGDTLLRRCAVFVFFGPPSMRVLEQRLRSRGTDSDTVIARRLENAHGELASWREFDYLLINDRVDRAVVRLRAILTGARCAVARVRSCRGWLATAVPAAAPRRQGR